jgi:hypothetical protein
MRSRRQLALVLLLAAVVYAGCATSQAPYGARRANTLTEPGLLQMSDANDDWGPPLLLGGSFLYLVGQFFQGRSL